MTKPNWVANSIFYQIFPDRFFNGDTNNDPPNVKPWNSRPTNKSFHGGDLIGITKKLDYLLDLGINAIYLNPIFQSPSNHRYNTYDYFKIDPKLGDLDDFKFFLDITHNNNIYVVLDGVFNHCGRGFFAFNDILENNIDSPYKDWFITKSYPLDAYSPGKANKYEAWWHIKSLPKFNTKNPEVRDYLFQIARYWIEMGADGWRLDVPNEIDDMEFWQDFCSEVKSINKNAYILGEIWTPDTKWVEEGLFDGLMNYPLRNTLIKTLNNENDNISDFTNEIKNLINIYSAYSDSYNYQLLSSHDTERIFTALRGNIDKIKLAYLFLFSLTGTPAIYYGDEIGMRGGKDPGCRGTFNWDQNSWNSEILNWIKHLINVRKTNRLLRSGDISIIEKYQSVNCILLVRSLDSKELIMPFNFSNQVLNIDFQIDDQYLSENIQFIDILTNENLKPTNSYLNLKLLPFSGKWIAYNSD
jgi:cyclomaltodextrinase / maltogenic alpha-amylase / neopullulanase